MRLATATSRYAFTLIETLAIIVLLSLIAMIVGTGLVQADDSAKFSASLAIIRDLDARGRLHARTGGAAVALELTKEPDSLRLMKNATREVLAEHAIPGGTAIEIQSQPPADGIVFDRCGRSPDYFVIVSAGESRRHLQVNGLTGWIAEAKEDQ